MAEKRVLRLTLTRQWFDLIAQGVKKEEYREIGKVNRKGDFTYWAENRLLFHYRAYVAIHKREPLSEEGELPLYNKYDEVLFKNGYGPNVPSMRVEFNGCDIGPVNPDWAPEGTTGNYFRIKLGDVLEVTNWEGPK